MKYLVSVTKTALCYELCIPDFDLSWEYPIVGMTPTRLRAAAMSRLLSAIQEFIDCREDVPPPVMTKADVVDADTSTRYMELSFPVALKVAAYRCWRESKLTERQLTRESGFSRTTVRNVFQLELNCELRTIHTIFAVLGYSIDFTVDRKKEKRSS